MRVSRGLQGAAGAVRAVSRSQTLAATAPASELRTEFDVRVVFVTQLIPEYRRGFHEGARAKLAAHGVKYDVVFGAPTKEQSQKGDLIDLPWTRGVNTRHLWGDKLIWQNALGAIAGADLVVLNQQNRNIINYLLQMTPRSARPRIAFFGHGRNFQAEDPNSMAERWKRYWATKVDWWFAYTQESKNHLIGLKYPEERITILNNSIDTRELARLSSTVTAERRAERRSELGLSGRNTCVLVAAFYPEKRIGFLIEALDLVRAEVPDFEFVAIGGGIDLPLLESAATTRPWLKVMGPRFGKDKAELMSLGKLFLLPGLVGLAVLDAGVMGLPVVTTGFPHHSPEIAYLEDGKSGRIVAEWTDVRAYAATVIDLLNGDPGRLAEMSACSRKIASTYSMEAMTERFADGALRAIGKTR